MQECFLDCTGLKCPMPIVKISLVMKGLTAGEKLHVQATDPAFRADLEAWVRRVGHRLLEYRAGTPQQAVLEKV